MTRRVRRVVLVLAAVGALAGAAFFLASREGAPPAGAPDAGEAAGSSAQPSGAAPIAVPTSAAPSSMAVEPGPADEVATDEPVTAGGAQVVLGYAEWNGGLDRVEAAGFVSGVVENGGDCELLLIRGEERVTATGIAAADASTTVCGALVVPGDRLADGSWSAILEYRSSTSAGSSAPVAVTVRR